MGRFAEIQTALDERLATLSDAPAIAWENVRFEPVEGVAWIRPTNLPGGASSIGLENTSSNRTLGIYQVDVFTPAQQGPGAALALADRIAALFPKGQRITSGNSAVVLGVPAQDPGEPGGAWYRIAVLIPYDVLT